MNAQAHMSGKVPPNKGTMPQNNGNSQMQNLASSNVGTSRNNITCPMDHDISKLRQYMQTLVFNMLQQRQPSPADAASKAKYMDVAKRLEEGLFKMAIAKEDYMNRSTLESRIGSLIRGRQLNNQNQRQSNSSSVGTMIPTPGLPQTSGNPNSSTDTTIPANNNTAVNTGNLSVVGNMSNGYQHSARSLSVGSQRSTSQMIPTPGFINSGTSNNNSGGFSVEPTIVPQSQQQQQQQRQHLGGQTSHMLSNQTSASLRPNMQPKPSSMANSSGNGLQQSHQQQYQPQPNRIQQQPNQIQQQQQILHQKKQQILQKHRSTSNDGLGKGQNEPGTENHSQAMQSQAAESFQLSQFQNQYQNSVEDAQLLSVASQSDACTSQKANSQMSHGMSSEKRIREDLHQRITTTDEAQPNNLPEGSVIGQNHSSTVVSGSNSSTGMNFRYGNVGRDPKYINQQKWLLFLRHARTCKPPGGKCLDPNCASVQKLLIHMDTCDDPQCPFPRCRPTKSLIGHYRNCKDIGCPVCVPVKTYHQQQANARAAQAHLESESTTASPVNRGAAGASSQCADSLENLQPALKRLKVEQSFKPIVPKTEVPLKSESVEVKEEVVENVPKPGLVSEPCKLEQKQENVKVEKESELVKKEVLVETSGVASKSVKPKIKGVSLTELFTPEQVREHIRGLRQWVGQSKAKAEKNQAMENTMSENSCQLCAVERLAFEPPPIYCTPCGARIKRNAMYFTVARGETRHYFCIPCYNESRGDSILAEGTSIPKARLDKKKNDEETEEWWVQCDKCELWQHQICALFNGRRNDGGQAEYTCPNCYILEVEQNERKPLPQSAVLGAKDLPRTSLSDHIEQRLSKVLKQERTDRAMFQGNRYDEISTAESLVVRVVSSVDKKLEVKPRFLEIFQEDNFPTEFPYKSKVVLLFQNIEGVEVCLFGMYVQEFGSECSSPNERRIYLSYLDSVKYFRPDIKSANGEALRTFVYHEILIGYLEYCKLRGFTSCYIWACPPLKGEDYILYCHPEIQKTPKSDKLREWYLAMLRKASKEGIVAETTNLYDHFFLQTGECRAKVTAARLPYFDGDYWPGAAEDIISQMSQEDDGRKGNKKGVMKKAFTKRALKGLSQSDLPGNTSKDMLLMHKLGETIQPMKEDFIMVHLQHCCTHCCMLMVNGNRWVCNQCKDFHLCDGCYDAEQRREDRERHPLNQKEIHKLYPVEITDIPMDTKDKDEILESEFFDTRQAFLSLCQGNHYQYDTLRRAKHSSMMVLYHLHNPTAPAFVTTCNACHLDIESGQGWRCEVCPDYDVCNICYSNGCVNHPHKLIKHPSLADQNAQNKEARQLRVLQLRKMLDLLVHASQCRSPQCQYLNCRKVKGLFRHGFHCKLRASGGCGLCKKMWNLLQLHARACKESKCDVPRCCDLKEHLRRLQQQSDSRRRAAVMEMMRQRAAEVAGTSG